MVQKRKRAVEERPTLFGTPDQLLKKPGPSATKRVLPSKELVPAIVKRHFAGDNGTTKPRPSMSKVMKIKKSEGVEKEAKRAG